MAGAFGAALRHAARSSHKPLAGRAVARPARRDAATAATCAAAVATATPIAAATATATVSAAASATPRKLMPPCTGAFLNGRHIVFAALHFSHV